MSAPVATATPAFEQHRNRWFGDFSALSVDDVAGVDQAVRELARPLAALKERCEGTWDWSNDATNVYGCLRYCGDLARMVLEALVRYRGPKPVLSGHARWQAARKATQVLEALVRVQAMAATSDPIGGDYSRVSQQSVLDLGYAVRGLGDTLLEFRWQWLDG